MADIVQGAPTEQVPALYTKEPRGTIAGSLGVPLNQPYLASDQVDPNSPGTLEPGVIPPFVATDFPAEEVLQASGGYDWFETFHVVPRSFDFGNLLSDQSVPIEVFCSFRRPPQREWTSFVNNAGAGVTLVGLPSLPTQMDPLSGIQMTLLVDANGAPFVDDTLDFGFSGIGTIFVSIMIQRLVLWGLVPESPFRETLSFRTNVKTKEEGKEQRAKMRKNPRQSWDYRYLMDEGPEAQTLENLLFDFHALNFGVPVWDEDTETTTVTAAAATSIDVGSTEYRDFRVGGFAGIIEGQTIFDVLEITALTATLIDFTTPTTNGYPIGTKVYPMSISRAPARTPGSRYLVNLRNKSIKFTANNNDVDLADLGPFSTFNGKLLLDVGNVVRGQTSPEANVRRLDMIDGQVGRVFQDSAWDRDRRRYQFTMRAAGRQALWEMRGMVHAISGRWKSFYVPTAENAFTPVANLGNGSNTLDVTNVGYTQFVRSRQAKNVIRVTTTDGSVLLRTILSSTVIDADTEQLTLDGNWPQEYPPAEVLRIEYVEKVRMDTDDVNFDHDQGNITRMAVPLITVLE